MFYLESPSRDPYFNLALEEYVFERMDKSKSYFMLWQNDNTIVVGKYQNTAEEIDQAYVDAHGTVWPGGCPRPGRYTTTRAI